MQCPFCGHKELKVTDSREANDSNAIRRRRECLQCGGRFTTFETVELNLQVLKRDGRYEDFQRTKLFQGILAACRHTTVSQSQVASLTDKIITDLMTGNRRSISTRELGDMVMGYLKNLDPVAYIRFACVYQRFKAIEDFKEAIDNIHPKDREVRSAEPADEQPRPGHN